jgi:hypothetical protein
MIESDKLMDGLRSELHRVLFADDRSIRKICHAAGVHDSCVYLFLKGTRRNLCATTLLSIASELGYRVTFEKVDE